MHQGGKNPPDYMQKFTRSTQLMFPQHQFYFNIIY
jgi:hypothetical protein